MTYRHIILATASLLALSACSGGGSAKEVLGLERSTPDEYRVVSRPPLSVPPQFALRPPSATETGPGQQSAATQAQSMILSGDKPSKTATKMTGSTSGDAQFLKKAGAERADPAVRSQLVEERYVKQEKKETSRWWNPFEDEREPIVDAKKESDRIQKNEDEGKPVTEGDTAEVKPKDRGVLGRWLGY